MARPKKPLGLQEGHLTSQMQKEKELQESMVCLGKEQLNKPPIWLRDRIAQKEWKRLVEQFKCIDVISNLDLNNLGAYCNAYSYYIESLEQMKGKPLTVPYTNKNGVTNVIENPLIKIQIKYSDEMKRFASLLGLTIDSRLKMGMLKLQDAKNNITAEFGDI